MDGTVETQPDGEKKEKKTRKNKGKKADEKVAESSGAAETQTEQKGKKKRKTKKDKKNKDAPKKPQSAFLLFSKDYRVILHQQNPKMTFSEKSKQTAKAWKELKPEEKAVYISRAKEYQNEYQQKMDAIPKVCMMKKIKKTMLSAQPSPRH